MLLSHKKFSLYLIALSMLVIGVYSYFVLNYKILYMHREYAMWTHVKNIVNKKNEESFDLIVIGDSRAKAGFKPDIFDDDQMRSINLSLGGATPIEGYFVLRNYLTNNPKPRYLLLSYAPFHISMQDTYWKTTVRYDFLKSVDYEFINRRSLELDNHKTLGVDNYIDYKIKPGKYFVEFLNGVRKQRWKINQQTLRSVEVSRGHYRFGSAEAADGLNIEAKQFEEVFYPSKLVEFFLIELLSLAKSEGVPVFWYTMPFNEASYKNTANSYVASYNQYIESISNQYSMIILNELYYLDNSYFGDPSHVYAGIDLVTADIKDKFDKHR